MEADRRFNRHIERQEQINREQQQLNERIQTEIERLDQIISFQSNNGHPNGRD